MPRSISQPSMLLELLQNVRSSKKSLKYKNNLVFLKSIDSTNTKI